MFNVGYQERFWAELKELKGKVEYVRLYLIESERFDTWLKVFLAVVSSSAIAGWAIWKEPRLQLLWPSLVATSQVLSAISRFLPWEKRAKAILGLIFDLEEILLFAERNWFEVAEGELTTKQIHELTIELKQRRSRAISKHMKEVNLPDRPGFIGQARLITDEYFRYYYGDGEPNVLIGEDDT